MTQTRRHPRPQPIQGERAASSRPKKTGKRKASGRSSMVRVLPLLIVAAVFVLGFRVTIVVQDVRTMMASVDVSQSTAFAQEDGGARVEPAEDEMDETGLVEDASASDDDVMMAEGEMLAGQDSDSDSINVDPQSFTPSEVELLQRLSERRKVIEAQAQELKTREAMLQAAESRIDGKIAELQQLEQTLTALVAEADEQQQAKIGQLVRIYGAMKPKDAARIFNDLDMPILITVVESMKENKVAPILSQMDAVKATAVTEALSMRKIIPGLEGDPQG